MKVLTMEDAATQTDDGHRTPRRGSGRIEIAAEEPVPSGRVAMHLQALFHQAVDPMWITDGSGVVVGRNAAAIELTGAAAARDRPLDEIVHEGDVPVMRQLLDRATSGVERARLRLRARTGRSARGGMRVSRSPDGQTILWFARIERGTFAAPLTVEARRVAVEPDVTRELALQVERAERKACAERIAREDAEGRERDRGWAMAIVSHALRATVDVLELALARAHGGDDAAAVVMVSRMTSIQRDLAQDLQDVWRVADCHLRRGFVAYHPADAARLVAAAFEGHDSTRGIRVESVIPDVDTAIGDENRVIVALLQLVQVAFELARPEEAITISVESSGDAISFAVRWRGEPLGSEQLDWDVTRLGGAEPDRCGMCCLVARQLVQLHRGRVRFARIEDGCSLVATMPRAPQQSTRPPRA